MFVFSDWLASLRILCQGSSLLYNVQTPCSAYPFIHPWTLGLLLSLGSCD